MQRRVQVNGTMKSQNMFDNKEILRLRKASFEKQKAIMATAQAQADEDEANIFEQEGKLLIHEKQMEEIKAEEGANLIAQGKPILNPGLKSWFDALQPDQEGYAELKAECETFAAFVAKFTTTQPNLPKGHAVAHAFDAPTCPAGS